MILTFNIPFFLRKVYYTLSNPFSPSCLLQLILDVRHPGTQATVRVQLCALPSWELIVPRKNILASRSFAFSGRDFALHVKTPKHGLEGFFSLATLGSASSGSAIDSVSVFCPHPPRYLYIPFAHYHNQSPLALSSFSYASLSLSLPPLPSSLSLYIYFHSTNTIRHLY